LTFAGITNVPQTFKLVIPIDGTEVNCEVKWRGKGEIGVEFVSQMLVDYRHIREKRPNRPH